MLNKNVNKYTLQANTHTSGNLIYASFEQYTPQNIT